MTKMTISEEEFEKHFLDVRKHAKPSPGQVLAQWQAIADFVDGWLKRNVMELLRKKAGGESAVKVMRNLVGCIEKDSIAVPLAMARDMQTMSDDEVAKKDYKMQIEHFYWVEKQYIPDDPHWSCISVIDKDDATNWKLDVTS